MRRILAGAKAATPSPSTPLPQTPQEALQYAEKVIGDAEAYEKGLSSARNIDFQAIQQRLQQLQTDLKECDRLLGNYIEKNGKDIAALFLQVRLDRVKFLIFPIQMSGGKVIQDTPMPERDPQNTLDRLLALDPNNAEAYYWKARLYGISGYVGTGGKFSKFSNAPADFTKAVEFARKAVQRAPQNVAYREALGIYLLSSGSLAAAADVMRPIQNGQHPMYRLLMDRTKLPVPQGAAPHPDMAQMFAMRQGNQSNAGLRVAAYAIAEPASQVEAFYRQHWKGFQLYKIDTETNPNELKMFGAYFHWQGTELQLANEKPPEKGNPPDSLLLLAMECQNPTEDAKKRLPIPVGDVFTFIVVINTRDAPPLIAPGSSR